MKSKIVSSLPTSFASQKIKGLIAETLIKPTEKSRLRIPVLVFDTLKNMRKFQKEGLKGGATGLALGYYIGFAYNRHTLDSKGETTDSVRCHDRTMIGAILLCKRYLTGRIIAHECTHAALSYYQRHKRSDQFPTTISDMDDEEIIAYAVGDFNKQVVAFLYREKLL